MSGRTGARGAGVGGLSTKNGRGAGVRRVGGGGQSEGWGAGAKKSEFWA